MCECVCKLGTTYAYSSVSQLLSTLKAAEPTTRSSELNIHLIVHYFDVSCQTVAIQLVRAERATIIFRLIAKRPPKLAFLS